MPSTSIIAVVVALIVLKLIVTWLEPRMAFFPMRGVQETPATAGLPYVDVSIRTSDGETLHAWWLEHPEPRAQVVFWHGNGGNLSLWLDVIVELRRRGFSVLAADYRGYGASTGTPSERGVYRDAAATVQEFTRRFRRPGIPVLYWGRSLGSPVAASSVATAPPDGLVLESPMPDARSVLRSNPILWLLSFLSSYRFSTSRFLDAYTGPLLVIHGDADSIVPFDAGRRVFADAPTPRKTFVRIPGADHNDPYVAGSTPYWRGVDDFVATVKRDR
ncbi:MAG: alpha/beta hydrolase [Vicinamibacterales bacterium]